MSPPKGTRSQLKFCRACDTFHAGGTCRRAAWLNALAFLSMLTFIALFAYALGELAIEGSR